MKPKGLEEIQNLIQNERNELKRSIQLLNDIELCLRGVKNKISEILLDPSNIIHDGYAYSSIEELQEDLIEDIKHLECSIFFREQGLMLLEKGYKFLNYSDDDIMTTNKSSIARFNLGCFIKDNQLISIRGGVLKKYIILDTVNITLEKSETVIISNTDNVSPNCFLYNNNGDTFIIVDNFFSIKKLYKIKEVNDDLSK